MIKKIHSLEKAVVFAFNLEGWDLIHTGETCLPFDAQGTTPKGRKAVIEMKFREKYYETKILEVSKYNALMNLDTDIEKFYYLQDPKENYLFWLIELLDLQKQELYCPNTTMWNKSKRNKNVYLLTEEQARIINPNTNADTET